MRHEHPTEGENATNSVEGVIDADIRVLWEPWMMEADRLLEDEDLIEVVFQAQGQRHAHSSTLGRAQTPAETVLR
ncbi:MAG: hypothetical protein JO323_12820, partial [Acidobacteriia bacterium]|nr:hypothetical protein [Terriglobia bacterium]